jgi:cation transport ATPase
MPSPPSPTAQIVAAVALAALGSFGPVTGALVHNLGSVAVVLNAARLVTTRLR